MLKRMISILCILTFAVSLLGIHSLAAALDMNRSCSLTLDYTIGETAFSDLEAKIYRVAEFRPEGGCRAVPPFDRYPVRINGITSQQEWQETADTLLAHIIADQLPATDTKTTAADGSVIFSGLQTGLYLVQGVTAQKDGNTYVFRDFMIYLPTPVDEGYDYDCTAKPKGSQQTTSESYKVLKLWKDSGADIVRPESVLIDILQDGVVQESIKLHSGNHWSYSWEDPDGKGVWSVVERDVPSGYVVAITESAGTFLVKNTAEDPEDPNPPADPDDPDVPVDPEDPNRPNEPVVPTPDNPKTGDTDPLWLYIIVMCLSGFALMVIGIGSVRGKRHGKNR